MAWRVRERSVLGFSSYVFKAGFSLSRPLFTRPADFRRRFLSLLSFKFREFGSVTALSVLEATNAGVKALDADPARGTVPSFSDLPVGGVADSIMKLPMSYRAESRGVVRPYDAI